MANRFNELNNSGLVSLNSNTVIGPDNYTDQYTAPQPLTIANPPLPNGGVTAAPGVSFVPGIYVTANGHLVERDGDMGLYDTVSGAPVRTDQCTFGPGLNAN